MSEGRKLKPAWPAALVVISAVFAFLPALFGRTVVDRPETLDIANQWLGFTNFIKTTYLAGRFPLWDPHDLCGMPFLAFSHTSSLYPPHVIAHVFLPSYTAAHAVLVFLHLSVAAGGAFLLFRRFTKGAPAAGLAAVAYAFAGFVFGNINFPPSLYTSAWLPLMFCSALELRARPRRLAFIALSFSFTAMILGGDLEMCLFAIMALGFEILAGEAKPGSRALLPVAAALALGGMIALPIILPGFELQTNSIRGTMDFMPEVSLLPLLAVPLLAVLPKPMPEVLYPANHGLDPYYLSGFLVLFALAAIKGPGRKRLLAFPAAVVYLVLIYAHPFNIIFHHVPILGGIQVPIRLWPPLTLLFFISAAVSLDRWIEDDGPEKSFSLPGAKIGAGILIALGLARLSTLGVSSTPLIKAVHLAAGAAFVTAGVFALTSQRAFSRARIAAGIITIDLIALALVSLPMTDPKRLEVDPRVKQFLENTSGQSRYAILSIRGIIDPVLPYHLGLRINADTIDAFIRTPPLTGAIKLMALYKDLSHSDDHGRLRRYDQMSMRNPANLRERPLILLSAINVEWIISRYPAPGLGPPVQLELAASWPDLFIYRVPNVAPRVLTDGTDNHYAPFGGDLPAAVQYIAPDEFIINPPGEPRPYRDLFIAASYYPGWTASQGARELKITREEFGDRQLRQVPPGPVTLRYIPQSFRAGLWAGIASLFAAIGFSLMNLRRPFL